MNIKALHTTLFAVSLLLWAFVSQFKRLLLMISLSMFSVVLTSGCSDSTDRSSSDPQDELPQYTPLVEPADGSEAVTRTAWITLKFDQPLPSASTIETFLDCDSIAPDVSANWVNEELLVINPETELPPIATCTVSWQHPNSTGSSSFDVADMGAPAIVAYDRDDSSTLTPFPDDVWLVENEESKTGYQLEIPVPDRDTGVSLLYGAMLAAAGELDGFSPVVPMVVPVPERLDSSTLPVTPEQSLDPLATVGLFAEEPGGGGTRIPFYLIQRNEENSDGSVSDNLVLFPTQLLDPQKRYVLVVTRRALLDVARPLEPSPFFTAALNGELSNGTAEGQRVGEILEEIVPFLQTQVSPPIFADDIAVAVRISIRSTDDFPRDPLSIREQLQQLPEPTYTIESVLPVKAFDEDGTEVESDLAAVVFGTWTLPTFRDGTFVARDSSGLPEPSGTQTIPFTLALPKSTAFGPVPITMYQHGSPGSAESEVPVQSINSLAEVGTAVIGFTDIANREIIPNGGTQALVFAIFQTVLFEGRAPEFLHTLVLAEQMAFLRFISGLGDLDVFPVDAPDGVPDLDVTAPLTYLGISEGSNLGTSLVAYAPEIRAAQLIAGGGYSSAILFHQGSEELYALASQLFSGLTRTDVYVNLAILQMGYDSQDTVNHSKYLYREPHDLGDSSRASLLVTAGLADSAIPPYSTETAAWGFGIPHLEPVQSPVPSLDRVSAPLSGNVNSSITAAYYQYVPVGVEGIPPTPGCETINESDGHFCAQWAQEALEQRKKFFRSSLEGPAPVITDPMATDN